jgi:hypothetical protein
MLPDFLDIEYLRTGSELQRKAYHTLLRSKILYHLAPFQPVLTGTLPLDIFIGGKSDLDIICCSAAFQPVEKILLSHFASATGFIFFEKMIRSVPTLLCRFQLDAFPIEIFCQHKPVLEQWAYRHMIVEYDLLKKYGEPFKQQVIELKQQGIKTEPAFAQLLGLTGDPYEALLNL